MELVLALGLAEHLLVVSGRHSAERIAHAESRGLYRPHVAPQRDNEAGRRVELHVAAVVKSDVT